MVVDYRIGKTRYSHPVRCDCCDIVIPLGAVVWLDGDNNRYCTIQCHRKGIAEAKKNLYSTIANYERIHKTVSDLAAKYGLKIQRDKSSYMIVDENNLVIQRSINNKAMSGKALIRKYVKANKIKKVVQQGLKSNYDCAMM